VIKKINRD